jgi:hypothetical protein
MERDFFTNSGLCWPTQTISSCIQNIRIFYYPTIQLNQTVLLALYLESHGQNLSPQMNHPDFNFHYFLQTLLKNAKMIQ